MKILDEIKDIIETRLVLPFYYQSLAKANVELDFATFPCVFCQLIPRGALIDDSGFMKDSAEVLLFFINTTVWESDSLENQTLIDAEKARAIEFLQHVKNSINMQVVGSTPYQNVYDKFDVNVTGISLQMTLKELEGEYSCLPVIFDLTFRNVQ